MCRDCKDTGEITLLTSTQVCDCVLTSIVACSEGADIECGGRKYRGVKGRAVRIDDPAPAPASDEVCFGTINGVTLSQPIAFDIETVNSDPLKRSEELVAAMAPASTFTLEVDVGGDIRTFTGLSKEAVDFVHAGLRAGWDAARVADHLDEMATAAKVQERSRRLADLEAAGYPEHEIEEMAERIEERLFSVDDDGEAVKIITEEVSALILRKVIRGAMSCLIPNVQKMPKGGFATGGVISGHKFQQQCGFSFVPEKCFGVSPTGREIRSDRQLAKSIITPMSATGCGKAEFFKRMYGGKPDPTIDTSQIELRMLAHYEEQYRERPVTPDDAFPGIPRAHPASPDAG